MGSGSSRMAVRSPRPRSDHRPKLSLGSFICGGASSSSATPQRDDEKLPGRLHDSVRNDNMNEASSSISSENNAVNIAGDHGRLSTSVNGDFHCSTKSTDAITDSSGKHITESKELLPRLPNSGSGMDINYSEKTCVSGSSSSELDKLEPTLSTSDFSVTLLDNSSMDSVSHTSSVRFSRTISHRELGETPPNITSTTEQPLDSILGIPNMSPNLASTTSTSALPLLGDDIIRETSFAVDRPSSGEISGNLYQVDAVSILSNVLPSWDGDIMNNEVRSNRRSVSWNAISRRTNRRDYESPTISSSTEGVDDVGSHARWLLDISDDLFESRFDYDSLYLQRRSHRTSGRRWHSRSQIRERLFGGNDHGSRHSTFCSSGNHPFGTCSCDSLLVAGGSNTRGSIARIVLLAEALYEVLDDLHRQQPLSFSTARPAPESVVNSFPVKSHIKNDADNISDDVEQCYICLVEYEEADRIRVLPCRHEYHMACVDKWLTEIHGVCPLCRRDVCKDEPEPSNSEI